MALAATSSLKLPPFSLPPPPPPRPNLLTAPASFPRRRCAPAAVRCAKRTGKRRYPSEKKRLERRNKELLRNAVPAEGGRGREEGFWRLSKLAVPARDDPGKDFTGVSPPLLQAIAKALKFPVASMLPEEAFSVIRKSFDARKVLKEPQFVYTVDMDVSKLLNLEPRTWDFIARLEPKLGAVEYLPDENVAPDLVSMLNVLKESFADELENMVNNGSICPQSKKPKVAVVGSGPSGLFASLVLGELGVEVTLLERGQPVEQRGHDIGALVVRRILQPESNFCFGEGGAGTWSDGKLVTRIGRNTDGVQAVLKTFVQFGAPPNILVDGKPHLGTDRLVRLLQNFRHHLRELGVTIMFNTRVDDLIVEGEHVKGVVVSDSRQEPDSVNQKLLFDAVVLAVGHSARDVYSMLRQHNIDISPKNFSVGLRIEHPQELIDRIQYSGLAAEVCKGRGRIPVADYKIVKSVGEGGAENDIKLMEQARCCYSFCMCPGGQVVLTSTNPSELCINGMSFSRRASKWANSALVVTVSSHDFESFQSHGPLAGVEFQREFERRAAVMGGGNFVVPVQCVTDFIDKRLSVTTLPPSSYRLGVRPSKLHELFPPYITEALQQSIVMIDKEMPGFISREALLHGVETRTSSPLQILRHGDTYESTSLRRLYPIGGEEFVEWDKIDGPEVVGGGGGGVEKLEKIQVLVRLRPLSEKEIARGEPAEWECINDTTIMFRSTFQDRPTAPTAYSFDRVFRSDCSTKEVYEGAKEVALAVVNGINSSIFAYGQTSSGKTYTMTGITEYTVADIYNYISKHEERAFVLKFSAMEIYNEVVRDLLSAENTPLRLWDDAEKGTYVENLTEVILRDWNHLKGLISVCEAQRRTGETFLNEKSSRSHQILRLIVESSAREFLNKDKSTTLVASANFVDLAGSERASQALSAGTRLKEGCHINKSLLALGTVIRKLSMGSNAHIPYRDSKLTRILQPCLGGNARTAIICTLSPATSHIEQSRNTLLFGSCAKEVVTNAQVNVVMSDKALVKHLQKEVARLESELRYPGSNSSLEALVKEKDNQIRKLEKEMKELKLQHDLAQSRLQDLLQAVGDHDPKHLVSGRGFTLHGAQPYEDEQSTTESSEIINNVQNFRYSVSSPPLSGMPLSISRDDSSQISHDDSVNLCKEVRCIETNDTGGNEGLDLSAAGSGSPQHSNVNSSMRGNYSSTSVNSRPLGETPITLQQHLENVRKPFVSLIKDLGSSSSSRVIGRSRSCRSLTSSTLFEDLEKDDCTPLNRSLVDFPGRPDRYHRRGSALNYDPESETLSRAGYMLSEISASKGAFKTNSSVACDAEFTGIGEFVAELKEMAKVQYQKQVGGQSGNEEFGEGTIRSTGLDPIGVVLQSPSQWPLEFEKKQQDIIELWHACGVSLVHRTYFFLLFKGDPADSIYMEVELRRLSFLRDTYSRGSTTDGNVFVGSLNTSVVASAKKLQREREMLCRQMHKRFSVEEREHIYAKWGVALDSKKRKLQVARRLWIETKDVEHVRESASLVARLIGLQESGQVLREMFGLSFAPQQPPTRRSYNNWRYGLSSLS